MEYVLVNGSVGNALLFLSSTNPVEFSTAPSEAITFPDLDEAINLAKSSYKAVEFLAIDHEPIFRRVAFQVFGSSIIEDCVG